METGKRRLGRKPSTGMTGIGGECPDSLGWSSAEPVCSSPAKTGERSVLKPGFLSPRFHIPLNRELPKMVERRLEAAKLIHRPFAVQCRSPGSLRPDVANARHRKGKDESVAKSV